jgi:mitogen-activated protein kinase 1/3
MWSIGCIFAQLLQMSDKKVRPDQRFPLFPGGSCYSLSGEANRRVHHDDQINMIVNVLGTPGKHELRYLEPSNSLARSLLARLPWRQTYSFQTLFPQASSPATHLLSKLLCYDPMQRLTASEALKHPYFLLFREEVIDKVSFVISLDDFLWEQQSNLTCKELKPLIVDELLSQLSQSMSTVKL